MVSLIFAIMPASRPHFLFSRRGWMGLDSGPEGARMTAINNTRNTRRMAGNFVKNNSDFLQKNASYVLKTELSYQLKKEV